MDIDLNDALHHLADDDQQPDAARDAAAGEATTEPVADVASTTDEVAAEAPAEPAEPVAGQVPAEGAADGEPTIEQAAPAAEPDAPAVEEAAPVEQVAPVAAATAATGGATAAPVPPVTAEPAVGEDEREGDTATADAAEEPARSHKVLWYAGAAAALVACGAAALWPGGSHDGDIAAAPASASATTAASASAVPTPALASTTPGAAARPSATATAWSWTGSDPAAAVLSSEQVAQRCHVKDTEQVVGPNGTTNLRPGMAVRIGPKSAKAPAGNALPTGWRSCMLGYQHQPVTAAVGATELSKVPANLASACSRHSGFDMAGWKIAVVDTRLNPRTNNVSDATVAMTGPSGWALGCEISAGADTATLTFLSPTSNACPTIHAAAMAAPGGAAGAPAKPVNGSGGAGGEGPGGSLYWVTGFGRVPAAARAKAVSGGYDIGKVSESAAMVRVGGGLAVANHTWKPDQADPSDTSRTPTVTFFDKAGKPLASCAAS